MFKIGSKCVVLCPWIEERTGFIGEVLACTNKDIHEYEIWLINSIRNKPPTIDIRYIKKHELIPFDAIGNYLYG